MKKQPSNYNDLRVIKTEKLIRGSFHELAQEKPISKITVRELVQRAEINKTTFYAHYETIQDLIDTLERETINYIIDNMGNVMQLFEDSDLFIDNLYRSLSDCQINSISHVNPNCSDFTQRLKEAINQALTENDINSKQYQKIRVLITFIVNGLLGLLRNPSVTQESDLNLIKEFVCAGLNTQPISR